MLLGSTIKERSVQFGEIGQENRKKKTNMDEEYEETLLMINECFVYKIPPRTSAEGYKYALLVLSMSMLKFNNKGRRTGTFPISSGLASLSFDPKEAHV